MVEVYLSEATAGFYDDWQEMSYHYRLIPLRAVPILPDDYDGQRHGYEREYIEEAMRRLGTRSPECLYARDAPLLLTHRGRWIGVAPVIP